MSIFDLVVLAILAALTLRGIWKGMISQIVSVASYLVCWLVATRFGSLVAPTIPLEAPWDQVVAMAIIFLITLIAIRFAYTVLEKLIKDWHLEKLNKSLGGLLGFIKGLLICLIITFFAVMLSETSRAVVFNSKTGTHLVKLIVQISLFVPKDSYEFVHTQFDQFKNQVDKAIPGQIPDTLPVQSSETVQQLAARLQQETENPRVGSLWNALSQWWSGSESSDTADTETLALIPQAETYTPPVLPMLSSPPSAPPADTFINTSQQPITPRSTAAVSDYFARQPATSAQPLAQLTALSPVPESPSPQLPALSSIPTLAPLSEAFPVLPEPNTRILPTSPSSSHIGSDLLLRNSEKTANPNVSARLFRP